MNKNELIKSVSRQLGVSQGQVENVLEAFMNTIKTTLADQNDVVRLIGFGTFEVREYGPRQGVNPRTGERIQIPGGRRVRFKASDKMLKDS